MDISAYYCPNCNRTFSANSTFDVLTQNVQLDSKKTYEYLNVFCDRCLTYIHGVVLDNAVLWNYKYQYYYDKYVKNYINNKKTKKYLYAYFPYCEQNVFLNMFNFIKLDQFDSLVIPQHYLKFIEWNKQICILPSSMFQCNVHNIYPNYLAEAIILKQMEKYENAMAYSLYPTFCKKFNILYNIKKWQKLKILVK